LYWKKYVLQDTHLNTSGKQSQRHKAENIMQKCAKKIHGEAHLHATFGLSTNVDKAQTHLGTDHMKVVIVDIC
jgi:hypothetical protein